MRRICVGRSRWWLTCTSLRYIPSFCLGETEQWVVVSHVQLRSVIVQLLESPDQLRLLGHLHDLIMRQLLALRFLLLQLSDSPQLLQHIADLLLLLCLVVYNVRRILSKFARGTPVLLCLFFPMQAVVFHRSCELDLVVVAGASAIF